MFLLRLYFNSPTVIGAAGERRLSALLRRKLEGQNYRLFDDLTLPTKRGTTQIDHTLITPHGIFVIETKNLSGWIFGGERQAHWTQTMRGRKFQFQNPLRQNYQHVKVVQDLLNVRDAQIENLVVFVGSAEAKTEMPANVFWSRHDLLAYIRSREILHFSDDDIHGFAEILNKEAFDGSKKTRRDHVKNLQIQTDQKNTDTSTCPNCGSDMVERNNKKTGEPFLGCSTFPKCRGSRRMG